MNITTPPIDPAHPLAKLIERSLKSHKLPSCEGCKQWKREKDPKAQDFGLCSLSDEEGSAAWVTGEHWYKHGWMTAKAHFCSAWEPKA